MRIFERRLSLEVPQLRVSILAMSDARYAVLQEVVASRLTDAALEDFTGLLNDTTTPQGARVDVVLEVYLRVETAPRVAEVLERLYEEAYDKDHQKRYGWSAKYEHVSLTQVARR